MLLLQLLEVANVVLPLQRLFLIDLAGKGDVAGMALRAESADVRHRRAGHINSRGSDILRKVQGNW